MGLMQKCLETYNEMEHDAGALTENRIPLAPIAHMVYPGKRITDTTKDESKIIRITLNEDGTFERADLIAENIVLPCTEDSAARGAGITPHPLCDKLEYISGEKPEKLKAYTELLGSWAASEYGTKILDIILKYVKGGTITDDLRNYKWATDKNGKLKVAKNYVAWRVEGSEGINEPHKDPSLRKAWISYYLEDLSGKEEVLCMVSGETGIPSRKSIGFGQKKTAKIISNNGKTIPRFTSVDSNFSLTFEASQKVHNVLRWVISNYGVHTGSYTFVCWSPRQHKLPGLMSALNRSAPKSEPEYLEDMKKAVLGYKTDQSGNDEVVIASFSASGDGRYAITSYDEITMHDYLANLSGWDEICCWPNTYSKTISAPSLSRIVEFAFGTPRDGKDGQQITLSDKIRGMQMRRLISCRVGNRPIPQGLVKAITHKASKLHLYDEKNYNRSNLLQTTCAVLRKYYYDTRKEVWPMSLDKENTDRSYLFGRMLAVYEKMESDARSNEDNQDKRIPTALRYQAAFMQHPASTRIMIDKKIMKAYYKKLSHGSRVYYKKLLCDIDALLNECAIAELNKPLSPTFFLGYALQTKDLYTKKEDN